MTIAPRTDEFSARPARRTTSPYHAGKAPDWVGSASVNIVCSFVDVYRRTEFLSALRAKAAGAPTPGRERTAAAGQPPKPAEARARGTATSWAEDSGRAPQGAGRFASGATS